MTTMVENEKSSDQRADEPNREVDRGLGSAAVLLDRVEKDIRESFAGVDQDIRELRGEVKAQGESIRGEVNGLRAEMNTRFLELAAGFKSLQNTLLGVAGTIIAAAVGTIIALIVH